MSAVLVTGSAGSIRAKSVRVFAALGFDLVGIDNGVRRVFLGRDASTAWSRQRRAIAVKSYKHHDGDIRYRSLIDSIFARCGKAITAVIHGAAQPSHDWAAGDPQTDFAVNANGTLSHPRRRRKTAWKRSSSSRALTRCTETLRIVCRTKNASGNRSRASFCGAWDR